MYLPTVVFMGLDKLRASEPCESTCEPRKVSDFGLFAQVFAILAFLRLTYCYWPSSLPPLVKVSFVLFYCH